MSISNPIRKESKVYGPMPATEERFMMTKKKELLFTVTKEDCEWQYFRAGGKGGQKVNKTSSAVRCIHRPSGAVGKASDERYRQQNKKLAFKRMVETKEFKNWIKIEAAKKFGHIQAAEEYAEKEINSDRIKIEIKKEGKWVEE